MYSVSIMHNVPLAVHYIPLKCSANTKVQIPHKYKYSEHSWLSI